MTPTLKKTRTDSPAQWGDLDQLVAQAQAAAGSGVQVSHAQLRQTYSVK